MNQILDAISNPYARKVSVAAQLEARFAVRFNGHHFIINATIDLKASSEYDAIPIRYKIKDEQRQWLEEWLKKEKGDDFHPNDTYNVISQALNDSLAGDSHHQLIGVIRGESTMKKAEDAAVDDFETPYICIEEE